VFKVFRPPIRHERSNIRLDEILVSFTPLILKVASLLSNKDPNLREDLIQEGYIGLYQAIQHYRKERGSFPAFAKTCIRNAMISYLRKNKTKDLISLETIPDQPSEIDIDETLKQREFAKNLYAILTPMESTALKAFLYTGSIAEAARFLSWPYKRMENAIARARKKAGILVQLDKGGK